MNITLGFGDTEKRFENKLENHFRDYVVEKYNEENLGYFTEDFCKRMAKWADEQAKESQEIDASYKKAETYPDRYSQFWVSTVWDASNLVFVVSLIHTNRRHALSPDGWGAMTSDLCFCVKTWDAERIRSNKRATA